MGGVKVRPHSPSGRGNYSHELCRMFGVVIISFLDDSTHFRKRINVLKFHLSIIVSTYEIPHTSMTIYTIDTYATAIFFVNNPV